MKATLLTACILVCINTALKSQNLQTIKDSLTQWIDIDGNYEKALPLTLETAERLRRDSGEHNLSYAEFLYSFAGSIYEFTGDYKQAEYYYKEGMRLCGEVAGKNTSYAEACANLGNMYLTTGLQYPGLNLLEEAYNILSTSPQARIESLAGTMNNLALANQFLERYAEAQKIYGELLDVVESNTAFAANLPILYSNLGTMYLNMGDHNKALMYYNKTGDFGKYYGETNAKYIGIKSNIGILNAYTGNFKQSIKMLSSLDTVMQNLATQNPSLHIVILSKLASALYMNGDYTQSQYILLRAIDTANKNQLTTFPFAKNNMLLLANLYIDDKNYEAAETLLLPSLDSVRTINARTYFGYLITLERLYMAAQQPEKAAIYVQKVNDVAAEIYDNNFAFLSSNDKLTLLPVLQYALYNEINVALQKSSISDEEKNILFTHCVAMQSRLLQDQRSILNQLHNAGDDSVKYLYEKWINNRLDLDKQHYKQGDEKKPFVDSIQIETDAIESALVRRLNVTTADFSALQQIGIKQVQARLNKNDAFVEYIKYRVPVTGKQVYKEEYIALIVKKDGNAPVIQRLCSEDELAALISASASNNSHINKLYIDGRLRNKNFSYAGDSIFALLFKPLLPHLKDITTIYCSTDGLVNIIALHALPVSDAQIVVDRFNIRYISSCAQFVNNKDAIAKPLSATVWGGINYGANTATSISRNNTNWKFLPGSKTEINNIGSLLKSDNVEALIYAGDTASKPKFIALSGKQFNIVHLSTHGYVNPPAKQSQFTLPFYFLTTGVNENVMLDCGLVLSGANTYTNANVADSGYINAYEIASMDFSHTDLVALSACETAVGSIVNGEGVFGLNRAFLLAGVKNIIVSLWQVPDKETSEFMSSFYKQWLQGSTLAEAFETTQRLMRKKYTPYYWAGFKLIQQ